MHFWKFASLLSLISAAFIVVPAFKKFENKSNYVIIGLISIIALMATMLIYINIGNFAAIAITGNAVPSLSIENEPKHGALDLAGMTIQLEKKLKSQPDNLDGWVLLAKTYCETQEYQKALSAFKMAEKLAPKDAGLLADYADIMVLANGGIFDKNSERLIARAFALNPAHPKAMMLKATVLFNHKDFRAARSVWNKLLTVEGLPESIRNDIKANIAEVGNILDASGDSARQK